MSPQAAFFRAFALLGALLLGAGLALCGCARDLSGPADVVVLAWDRNARRYVPKTVRLETATDLLTLTGPAARLTGNARIVIDESDPAYRAARTLHELRLAIVKDPGSPVRVDYLEQPDGTLVPADFHSLNLATTYYNFERAFALVSRIAGVTPSAMGTPVVYYFPVFELEAQTVRDNALFMPLIEGFMILPFDSLQEVPLAINIGVVGHEFSHSVFNHLVHGGSLSPAPYAAWSSETAASPGLNLLRSLDEGVADVLGTALTCGDDLTGCDSTFLSHSLPEVIGGKRRVDAPHCLGKDAHEALQTLPSEPFADSQKPYEVGSVFASTLWRAASEAAVMAAAGGEGPARAAMLWVALASLSGDGPARPGFRDLVAQALEKGQAHFGLTSTETRVGVLEAVIRAAAALPASLDPLRPEAVEALRPKLIEALCRAFVDQLGVPLDGIPSCPASTVPSAHCLR